MISYQEYEKKVFDWLYAKHQADRNFRFSVRIKASKGAQRDYFIGTEKSQYFGMTFWNIPLGYPGSAGDLIDLFFHGTGQGYKYYFEFIQTNSPDNDQNRYALQLVQNLKKKIEKHFSFTYETGPEHKIFKYHTRSGKDSYGSLDELLADVEKDLEKIFPIVDQGIKEIKAEHPEFKAHRITQEEFDSMIEKMHQRREKYASSGEHEVKQVNSQPANEQLKSSFPLNQILYGPPGTGKTYYTKNRALEILDGALPADREAVNKRYAELYQKGRIRFVAFHQSTSYEDFVEGIKPQLVSEEEDGGDDVKYKIEDGIFKSICIQAAHEYVKGQDKEKASAKTLTFSQLFDELVDRYQQQLDEGHEVSIPLKSGNLIDVTNISSQGNFILQHKDGQRTYTASKSRLEKLFNEIDDFDAIPNIYSYFRSIIGGSNASAYWAILNQIYTLQEQGAVAAEDAPVSYEDKRKAFERINWRDIDAGQEVPKYLLIIDEINRGNIAAILGELITLLEEDKRGGNKESLEVTLPYSKSNFAVPPNLYIIGTMNTADRSVEALDTALRRRFAFQEIGPQPELLSPKAMIVSLFNKKEYVKVERWEDPPYDSDSKKLYEFLGIDKTHVEKPFWDKPGTLGKTDWKESDLEHLQDTDFKGIRLDKLLQAINGRIRKLIDKDHMIGHAYFMGIWEAEDPLQELRLAFRNKLLPLLQEYFYGNFGKIQLVLGRAFVEEELEGDIAFAPDADYEGEDYNGRKVYLIKEVNDMSDEDFRDAVIQIYTPHG